VARILTYLAFVFFTLLGLPLFLSPQTSAPVFPWKVSTFVAMTIGGWCLGNAWLAWITARRWRGRLVYSALIFLGLFGFLELAVAAVFRDKLVLAHPLSWLYLAALIVSLAAGLFRGFGWLRTRPPRTPIGLPVRRAHRAFMLAFVIFVRWPRHLRPGGATRRSRHERRHLPRGDVAFHLAQFRRLLSGPDVGGRLPST
jgi:hypothetical protein